MKEPSKVLVGNIEAGLIVKVIGKGTMEFCSDLFMYLSKFIDSGKIENIYFELSSALYLDSSFVGVILSIQKKLLKQGSPTVILLNPSEKVKEILNTMGLLELIPIQEESSFKNIELTDEVHLKLEKNYKDIQILLESHQNLMSINEDNRKRFMLVEEMLKKELERQRK
jgi:anti-anti-sigma factor